MQVHHTTLSDVDRYLAKRAATALEDKREEYENILRCVRLVRPVEPNTRILEIGTGTGWFSVLCSIDGLSCRGLEISSQLVECATRLAISHGVTPNVELCNLEEVDLGTEQFDVIIARFVFEHVEFWRENIQKLSTALRPGGAFLFASTNKFAPICGEFPKLPLYGWLPDCWRYRIRKIVHGPDIMKLGIDYNQFTYPQLRRVFREVGFSVILDRVDLADDRSIVNPLKRAVVSLSRRSRIVRNILLLFFEATCFVCRK